MPTRLRTIVAKLLPAVLLSLACCSDANDIFKVFKPKEEKPPEPEPQPLTKGDPLLGDTIRARTLLSSAQPMRLRGFGVVVGLGDQGGSDAPTAVREYLLEFLGKELTPRSGLPARRLVSPTKLLDSPDTAVVEVQGVVPAGAPQGCPFDVQLVALGSETRSVAGGVLLPCELKIYQPDSTGRGMIEGRALARAGGCVFTNPFSEPDDRDFAQAQLRGLVLGGGKTLEPRNLRLMLDEPSYAVARRIESRINERFGQSPAVAEAMSRGYVELNTPARYAERPDAFQQLVAHVTLEGSPEYLERRLLDINESLGRDAEALPNFSLIWEGIGTRALPTLAALYGHADEQVRLYAARAGARLGDASALPTLAEIATSGKRDLRLMAARELADFQRPQAGELLLQLLDAEDSQVRIAAYEGLRTGRHPAVASTIFASVVEPFPLNFVLEVVETTGRPLIYARRTREPRIALFGVDARVSTPLFYSRHDDRLTLSAGAGEREITVLSRANEKFGKPVVIPSRVVDLIAALGAPPDARRGRAGLGLTYSEVLHTLEKLTKDGSIEAELVLEQVALTDLLGPRRETGGRSETDREPPSRPEDEDESAPDASRSESEPGAGDEPREPADDQRPDGEPDRPRDESGRSEGDPGVDAGSGGAP